MYIMCMHIIDNMYIPLHPWTPSLDSTPRLDSRQGQVESRGAQFAWSPGV